MTTRFYFQNLFPSDLTPAISPGWGWMAQASYWALTTEKNPQDLLSNGATVGPFAPGIDAVDRVYVSDRLAGQFLQGTVSLYVQTQESNADDNITTVIEMYLVDQFGAIRGSLLPRDHYGSSSEYSVGSYQNREYLENTPILPIDALQGDRIVIILGHRSTLGVTPSASARWGSDTALDDLSSNETQTTSGIPFALFSADIEFDGNPADTRDDGGHGCVEDPAEPPDPQVPPTETPPPVPNYLTVHLDQPPNAIPHEGIDEIIHLMRVDGNTKDGFTYKVHKVLSPNYQELEWWYHRKGGCGSFRLITRDQNILADFADRSAYAWEIWVRIRLPNDPSYTNWYRGEIKSVTNEHAGGEMIADVRGMGYVEQLQGMYLSRIFPAGMTVKEILDTILTEYVYPGTRITPANLADPTNYGLTDSNYETFGDLQFECSVYRALKFLAELQGDIEWGVDANSRFYWKKELSVPGQAFFLSHDSVFSRAGAYSNELKTKVRFEGSLTSGKELLRIINDVTDPTDFIQKQEYTQVAEHPWVAHKTDAQHWADNLLQIKRRFQHWRVVRWGEVKARLEANHPHAGLRRVLWRDAVDVTNDFSEYEISKIHYRKGGTIPTQIHEKARTKSSHDRPQTTLSAEVWLGAPPRTFGEDLNKIQDDIDALKGKWKQFRFPGEVTSRQTLPAPRTFGEQRFFTGDITSLRDVTLLDVTNKPVEQVDPTNKIGIPIYYGGPEQGWVKYSIRRTVYNLPSRGFFPGEVICKITDITNHIGDLYKWTGAAWESLSTSVEFVKKDGTSEWVEHTVVPFTPSADRHKLYPYDKGFYHLNDQGEEVGPIRDAPNHWRSVFAWQKCAGEQSFVLIGARANPTTEGTESATNDSDGQYLRYISAGTAGSDAGWLADSFSRFARQNTPIFDAILKPHTDLTDARFWAGLTSGDLMGSTPGSPGAIHYAAFRCDRNAGETTWWAVVADGSGSATAYNTGVTHALDTKYRLRIDMHKESGKVFFYIDGILRATATSSDFLPGLTQMMAPQVEVRKVLSGGAAKAIKIQKVAVEYNG